MATKILQAAFDHFVEVPVIEDIHKKLATAIAEEIEWEPSAFDMNVWHQHSACGSRHCWAGWVVHLAGDEGYALEQHLSHNRDGLSTMGADNPTARAARLIYEASDPEAWERMKDGYFDVFIEEGEALSNIDALAREGEPKFTDLWSEVRENVERELFESEEFRVDFDEFGRQMHCEKPIYDGNGDIVDVEYEEGCEYDYFVESWLPSYDDYSAKLKEEWAKHTLREVR